MSLSVLVPTDSRIDESLSALGSSVPIRSYMAWQEISSGARTSKAIVLVLLFEAYTRIIDNQQINVYLKLGDLANSPIGFKALRDAMFVTTKTGEPLTKEKLFRTAKTLEQDMQKYVQTAYLKATECKSTECKSGAQLQREQSR